MGDDSGDGRDVTLDRFRGGLILLMVAGNLAAGVEAVPAWLKHAPDTGLTVADLVAPGFVFAIGMTFGPSYARRARAGRAAATAHVVTRALALIGVGAIISAGSTVVAGIPSQWGVLQALGAATLVALPVLGFGPIARGAVGLALVAVYQVLLASGFVSVAPMTDHGGFAASLSWGGMLVLATVARDAWDAGRGRYLVTCAALALLGAAAAVIIPVSKVRVSASYVLIALAVAAVAYLILDLVTARVSRRSGLIAWWGENPLALYLTHLILLGAVQLLGPAGYSFAPLWRTLAELVVLLIALSLLAYRLHERGTRLRLWGPRALSASVDDPHAGDMGMSARQYLSMAGAAGASAELSAELCWVALESTSLGRLAVLRLQGDVDILPINYTVDGTKIYFRTAPGSKFEALTANAPVALEIDGVDDEAAYSVVVKGRAERLESPSEIDAADALALTPWTPTRKLRWVRIRPTEVTGRVFARGAEPDSYA